MEDQVGGDALVCQTEGEVRGLAGMAVYLMVWGAVFFLLCFLCGAAIGVWTWPWLVTGLGMAVLAFAMQRYSDGD